MEELNLVLLEVKLACSCAIDHGLKDDFLSRGTTDLSQVL